MKLILASGSEFRKRLLEDAGFTFEVMPANIDEKLFRNPKPSVLVSLLAKEKVDKVAKSFFRGADYILIGSDQVVVSDKEILEKPIYEDGTPNMTMVKRIFKRYPHHPPKTYTSVMVYNLKTGMRYYDYDVSTMLLSPFSDEEIESILTDPVTYKVAGGIATGVPFSVASKIIEKHEIRLIGDRTGFIGLPIDMTMRLLSKIGYLSLWKVPAEASLNGKKAMA